MKPFKETVRKLGACKEAIDWVDGKTYKKAYKTCERADWMLWYASRVWDEPGFPAKKQVLLAACDCAELALEFVPKGDTRPAQAIAAARLAIEDPSKENLEAANAAAYASLAAHAASSAASLVASVASKTASYSSSHATLYTAFVASSAAKAGVSQVTLCNLIRARIGVK